MFVVPDFSNIHVLVIGDVMLDRYWHGDTSRISPEAPVPVVRIEDTEERAGGAANVAINLSALGVKTTLIGVVGKDDAGRILQERLEAEGVQCAFFQSDEFSTITKLRILGQHQQLIRIDFEKSMFGTIASLDPLVKQHLPQADIVILSDYAKGALSDPQKIIRAAKAMNKKVLVDPKNSDFAVYRGADLIKPNWKEFEAAKGARILGAQLEAKGMKMLKEYDFSALLITRGAQGMALLSCDNPMLTIPAHQREVFDVTGAGDTVLALMGACMATNTALTLSANIANVAASLAVGKLGAATISREEIEREYHQYVSEDSTSCVVSEAQLIRYVNMEKDKGETLVMTNGCFDLLHVGHISYLEEAKLLGDKLIVAVNDDNSVRRLKGSHRPIYELSQRMRMLAALKCVDWVVAFSEDTPKTLITKVLPDVLVKGGDYTPNDVAGGVDVIRNGGTVKILPFIKGYSSTNVLLKIEKEMSNKTESGVGVVI